ncbi:hypothetical protein [Solibacillus sp. FSL H8-0538]
MPHIYVILVGLMVIAYIATIIIPKGSFERVEGPSGSNIVVPGSF